MNAYWKAILAALSAGGASLVASGVPLPPWVTAVLSALVALGVVTTVPNAGFVNLNKVHGNEVEYGLAPAAFEAYQQRMTTANTPTELRSISQLPEVQRGAWVAASNAVVSQLRR